MKVLLFLTLILISGCVGNPNISSGTLVEYACDTKYGAIVMKIAITIDDLKYQLKEKHRVEENLICNEIYIRKTTKNYQAMSGGC